MWWVCIASPRISVSVRSQTKTAPKTRHVVRLPSYRYTKMVAHNLRQRVAPSRQGCIMRLLRFYSIYCRPRYLLFASCYYYCASFLPTFTKHHGGPRAYVHPTCRYVQQVHGPVTTTSRTKGPYAYANCCSSDAGSLKLQVFFLCFLHLFQFQVRTNACFAECVRVVSAVTLESAIPGSSTVSSACTLTVHFTCCKHLLVRYLPTHRGRGRCNSTALTRYSRTA